MKTVDDLTVEQRYRYEERLGILCEDRAPTPEQHAIAWKEAVAYQEPTDQNETTGSSA
jgi:hypothetical protein